MVRLETHVLGTVKTTEECYLPEYDLIEYGDCKYYLCCSIRHVVHHTS